jgi:hypothetical protein
MEPEGSLPYSQVPATCPYPEPTPSSPHDPLQLPEHSSSVLMNSRTQNVLCCIVAILLSTKGVMGLLYTSGYYDKSRWKIEVLKEHVPLPYGLSRERTEFSVVSSRQTSHLRCDTANMKALALSKLLAYQFANDFSDVAKFAELAALRYGVASFFFFFTKNCYRFIRKHVVINLYSTAVNTEHKLFCLVKSVMGCSIPSYTSGNIYTVSH